jgi:hypothetical protein
MADHVRDIGRLLPATPIPAGPMPDGHRAKMRPGRVAILGGGPGGLYAARFPQTG